MATPYSADPTLYLYTSLTAGSSHIITATSRLETILKANKIPFRALDVATDEKARMLWGRRSKGRKLPGLVKFGTVVGDLEEIEEWNEYGELKQQIGSVSDIGGTPSTTPSKPTEEPIADSAPPTVSQSTARSTSEARHISISEPKETAASNNATTGANKSVDTPLTMAMRQAGAEAAAKAGQKKSLKATPTTVPTISASITSPDEPKPDITKTTAPITEPIIDASSSDPTSSVEATGTKTPAQLAAEGAKRTSVDKIAQAETSIIPGSPPSPSASTSDHPSSPGPPASNEEQILSRRRENSVTKKPSRLSTQLEPSDIRPTATSSSSSSSASQPRPQSQSPGSPSQPRHFEIPAPGSMTRREHRASSISQASREEIEEAEKRNLIPEEAGESGSGGEADEDEDEEDKEEKDEK